MARDPRAIKIFGTGAGRYPLEKYYAPVDGRPDFYLMHAGRRSPVAAAGSESYYEKVRGFDWDHFYHNYGSFFTHFRQMLMEHFDYVLIDSRTGLTDIGGICTRVMPEKLVLVFVPNHQNIDGVVDVATKSIGYRRASRDPRGLLIFPIASRIESHSGLRNTWRKGGPVRGGTISGYQGRFESLLRDAYRLDRCDLEDYFDATQVPHDSNYAYGEAVAAAIDGTRDPLTIGYKCEQLARRLARSAAPWEALDAQPEPAEDQALVFISYRHADAAAAGRLHEDLTARLGRGQVFRDAAAPGVGATGVSAIEAAQGSIAAVIALIGRDWIGSTAAPGPAGSAESTGSVPAEPADHVRGEIAAALRRGLAVIPVTLDEAEMPTPSELPGDLQALGSLIPLPLRSASWAADIDQLATVLTAILGPLRARTLPEALGAWRKLADSLTQTGELAPPETRDALRGLSESLSQLEESAPRPIRPTEAPDSPVREPAGSSLRPELGTSGAAEKGTGGEGAAVKRSVWARIARWFRSFFGAGGG
jgi:hypothetical protein